MAAQFRTDALGGLYHQPPEPLPPPSEEPKRELLIFAVYIDVGTQSEAKARERLSEIHQMYGKTFREIESQTNYLIKSFIMPIKDGNSRMECIFSGTNTKSGPANMEELLGSLTPEEPEAEGFTVGAKKPKKRPEWESAAERLSNYAPSMRTLYE